MHNFVQKGVAMFNFHNRKTKRVVSAIIIAILVLAMVIPTLSYLVF